MYTYDKEKKPVSKAKMFSGHSPVIQRKLEGRLKHLISEDILAALEVDYMYPSVNRELCLSIIEACIDSPHKEYTELRQIADVLHLTPVYNPYELVFVITSLYQNEGLPQRTDIINAILQHYSEYFSLKSIGRLIARPDFSMNLQEIIHLNRLLHIGREKTRVLEDLGRAQAAHEYAEEEYDKYSAKQIPLSESASSSQVPSSVGPPPPPWDSRLDKLRGEKDRAHRQVNSLKKSLADIEAENDLLKRILVISPAQSKTKIPQALRIEEFTLRHYTTVEKPTFKSIRSALSLGWRKLRV